MTESLYDELLEEPTPLSVPGRVLTIGAHPDDAEFGAGATLARWAANGAHVTMLIVTDGSKGSWDLATDEETLTSLRRGEQARAAAVLGASRVIHLDRVDGELENTMDLRRDLALHIRAAEPDVLLTHDPWQRYQLHPDHRAAGFAAVDAVVASREPLAYRDSNTQAHRPATLLLWSPDTPDHAEAVTREWFDRKVEALLCHASQGSTTMGDATESTENREAFIEKLAVWHSKHGEPFGIGPVESFKRITP